MTELPGIVVQAAAALGLDPAGLTGLRGASGSSWDAGPAVLRVGPRVLLDRELAAAGAAAAVLPVPRVLDRADFAEHSALLLEWLPGRPAGDPVLDRARTWAILSLDPMARAAHTLPGWAALVEGWSETGWLADIPAAARAWACRFMLADLANRYSPAELAHVRRTLDQLA